MNPIYRFYIAPQTDYNNLFSTSGATVGYNIVYTTGELVASSANTTSRFIPITGGQLYYIRYVRGLAFYDENQAYVSGVAPQYRHGDNGVNTDYIVVAAPKNARYIRVSNRHTLSEWSNQTITTAARRFPDL